MRGHVVPDAPLLDRLAVAEPEEVDVVVRDLAPGRRDPHQVAGLPAVVREVDGDEIAIA